MDKELLKKIKYNENLLVPVITQDYKTNQVLMQAYANAEAMEKTLETGYVHYFSRSRNELWKKGETSGHFQIVKSIYLDCDYDSVLIGVEQVGCACHTGAISCFFNEVIKRDESECAHPTDGQIIEKVYDVVVDRVKNPKEGSYTNYLFSKGIDKMLKKVGEESTEVIIASKNRDKAEITYEISDLIYHLSVVMVETGIGWNDIYAELSKRFGK